MLFTKLSPVCVFSTVVASSFTWSSKKSLEILEKKGFFFVFSCIFKSVEIKDLKTFYTYFGDIFLKKLVVVENRSCPNFFAWMDFTYTEYSDHFFALITFSSLIMFKGSNHLEVVVVEDKKKSRICSLWEAFLIIYIFSNWSTRRLVLPFRTSRSVLYLSRPCLTFSLWILSMVVSPVSSRVWDSSSLRERS